MPQDRKDIFLVVGPAGSGKTELVERLKVKLPGVFGFPVSTTTRAPRPEDASKAYYRFVSRETFREYDENGLFALKNSWKIQAQRGELYGTLNADFQRFLVQLEAGKIGLFPVVPEAAGHLKAAYPERIFVIFLMVPENMRREWLYKAKDRAEPPESIEKGLQETREWLNYVRMRRIADYYLQNMQGQIEKTVETALNLIKYHAKIA